MTEVLDYKEELRQSNALLEPEDDQVRFDLMTNSVQYKLNMKDKNVDEDGQLSINLSYPSDPVYEFTSYLETINMDDERKSDLLNGKGFVITASKGIKNALKDDNGIYSKKYGQQLGDMNPYINRYRCECGKTESRINNGIICPNCHKPVKKVDDRYDYYGWFVLINHIVIHPMIYRKLDFFFGPGERGGKGSKKDKKKQTKLYNMLQYKRKIDKDGHAHPLDKVPKNQPFYGIGIAEFEKRFDEIMDYYLKQYPKKKPYYDDIMADREKVFTHSLPAFTTCLRPFNINEETKTMSYESINAKYSLISTLVYYINHSENDMDAYEKQMQSYLFDLQNTFNDIVTEIINILKDKKGKLRSLISGRFNFTARAVIVQNPNLRIDQVTMPYAAMVIMFEQKIKNILCRSHGYSPNDADQQWQKALINPDKEVCMILDSLIENGVPILLNRNPTIAYGSILCLYVVKYTMDLTIGVPLQVLKFMNADFDGDSLNVFLIINKALWKRADEIFNPRNAMYISRSDGTFNMQACVQRDTIINANTFIHLGRKNYTPEDMNKINEIREAQKRLWTTKQQS